MDNGIVAVLTLFSVGYFLRTESVGGHVCPPSVFSKKFPEPPLNKFVPLFVLLAYWGPRTYLGKVKESQHVLLSAKEHLATFFVRGGIYAPPPHLIGLRNK